MIMRLKGKNALVTGGSRGIGRAIALKFADEGANVAFTFLSSDEAAAELESELGERGVEANAIKADASSFAAAEETIAAVIDRWGTVDVLVNNAGITRDNLLLRMSEQDWDAVIDTNLKSAFNLCKAVYRPMMKQRQGKIINVSSVVGASGNAGQSNYAASKAGLVGFSKSLARELASRGVCVNVLAPGYVTTAMTEAISDTAREAMLAQIPLGRPAEADEIASAAVFLASPESDYITGHVLHVNGGMFM
jgi:3-oxoacyl-[acyl-carrier protein] reductase